MESQLVTDQHNLLHIETVLKFLEIFIIFVFFNSGKLQKNLYYLEGFLYFS